MASADPGDGAELQMLQQELLEHVLRLVPDPRTILNALAASKALRLAAAQLIDCIVIREAAPPAHTWQSFPRAARGRIHRTSHNNHALNVLRSIMPTLPSHITAIEGVDIRDNTLYPPSVEDSLSFAQALVASACCSNLLSVKLDHVKITSGAIDHILQGLPSLQEVLLWVSQDPKPGQDDEREQEEWWWSPKVQSCPDLVFLDISYDGYDWLYFDLSVLSSATKLQHLVSRRTDATNLSALQALTNLQHLDIGGTDCPAASWALLAKLPKLDTFKVWNLEIDASAPAAVVTSLHANEGGFFLLHDKEQLPGCLARQLPQLQHLQLDLDTDYGLLEEHEDGMRLAAALQGHKQLRELDITDTTLSAAAWALLAALPRLERVKADTISIDATAPEAAALTVCDSYLILEHTAQQLPGCLTRQLPQVKQVWSCKTHAMAVAAALAGHQQLQRLSAWSDGEDAGPAAGWGQDVLAALASCNQLQELELIMPDVVVTAAGCAALAAGACRESLRVVKLLDAVVEPALLAPLLHADMAALQQVVYGLPVEYDLAMVKQQVEQVLPAGGGWQWEIGVGRFVGSACCKLSREVAGLGAASAATG